MLMPRSMCPTYSHLSGRPSSRQGPGECPWLPISHAPGSGVRRMMRGAVRDTDTSQPRHKQCTGRVCQDSVFHCNAMLFKVLLLKEREGGGWGKTGFSKITEAHNIIQYRQTVLGLWKNQCHTISIEKHQLIYLLTLEKLSLKAYSLFFSFPKDTKRDFTQHLKK